MTTTLLIRITLPVLTMAFFDMRSHIVNEKDSIYVNQEYMKNVLDTLGIPEYTRDEWERRKEKARMFSEKLKNR